MSVDSLGDTVAGLVHLRELTNLETLDLRGTVATEAGAAKLHKALPNCKIVTSFTDDD